MSEHDNVLGCFVSATIGDTHGPLFRDYIWGQDGVCKVLKNLKHEKYGKHLKMILLQFYVNPIEFEANNLKDIENYRKKEYSIGIPIIVNKENFFDKTEQERLIFLKQTILKKIDLLEQTVKKKKLDTNIALLKLDLEKILL